MHLSGNLEDVSILDVLQILGLTGQSGSLHIESQHREAYVGFAGGRIASARLRPHHRYMTSELLEQGHISFESLHRALQRQKTPEGAGKPVGALLLEDDAVSREQLQGALRGHMQAIINAIATWNQGQFEFNLGAPEAGDDLGPYAADLVPELHVSPQELLLEAARIHDEARQAGVQGAQSSANADEGMARIAHLDDEAATPTLVLLSTDLLLQHGLRNAPGYPALRLRVVESILEATEILDAEHGPAATLVVDTDGMSAPSTTSEDLGRLAEQCPTLPILTCGAVMDPALYPLLLDGTIRAHLPRPPSEGDVEAAQQFVTTLHALVHRGGTGSASLPGAAGPALHELQRCSERLYDSVLTLRRNHHSVTVSLELLRFVANDMERAVLLLSQEEHLMVLGVCGLDRGPRPTETGEVSRMRLPQHDDSAVQATMQHKRITQVTPDPADPSLGPLLETIGAPRRPEAYLIPLVVRDRVFAVIYADNGDQDDSLCPPEPLGVLVEHGSQLLENLLIRRQQRGRSGQPRHPDATPAADSEGAPPADSLIPAEAQS